MAPRKCVPSSKVTVAFFTLRALLLTWYHGSARHISKSLQVLFANVRFLSRHLRLSSRQPHFFRDNFFAFRYNFVVAHSNFSSSETTSLSSAATSSLFKTSLLFSVTVYFRPVTSNSSHAIASIGLVTISTCLFSKIFKGNFALWPTIASLS